MTRYGRALTTTIDLHYYVRANQFLDVCEWLRSAEYYDVVYQVQTLT